MFYSLHSCCNQKPAHLDDIQKMKPLLSLNYFGFSHSFLHPLTLLLNICVKVRHLKPEGERKQETD